MATCAGCSAENAAGRRFCDQCGASLAPGCPACGAENRPGARFCGDCGTPLTAPLAGATPATPTGGTPATPTGGTPAEPGVSAAERRLVSVLFADLVAFTSYSEGRDPELVRETLTRYFEATREVVERHGGVVEKFIGDAVMAEWGAPRTNEDDAERAVRAALEVIEAVRNLGEGLHARVGVLTGQAAVTIGATDQGMVAGDLVNTAARLQAVASADTVLVGEATMQAASRAIAFEEAGEQVLRGKEAPVRAWRALRVVADKGGRSRTDAIEPPFVGRDLELRLLKDLVNAAGQERRPRLVSITGPAGIGKSRLAWEFEKYVDGLVEDVYWHRGRSPSYGEGIAFWALGEMVRRRAELLESDDEATTRAGIARATAEFVDEPDRAWVEAALLTLMGLEPPPPGGREALFAAWRTFFERIAATSTTVLIFEDLQWADDGLLDFIEHLLEWSREVPLLVITLARPELLDRRLGWGRGARSFNAIGLEPLAEGHMRALLLGLVPELPASAVELVLARADGIPLYAVEMVRSLVADRRLLRDGPATFRPAGDLGQLAIPDTLRALVASRLDSLEADDRSLVQDASVLGQAFDHRALAHIAGADPDAVEARLRPLVRREVLQLSGDPRSPERGQYAFVQSIIREVAYETLSRHDRRARHLAAARHFESVGDEELAAVLATHYLAAHDASPPGPEADALAGQARRSLRAAADRAIALGAPDQAVTHLESALRLTDDPSERGPLLLRAAAAAAMAANLERGEAFARSAIEAHGQARDERSALGGYAALSAILLDAGRPTEAIELLEPTVSRAEPFPEIQADLLARLARAYMREVRFEEAVATAERALAIAESRQLARIVAEALVNKGSAMIRMRRLHEPVILLRGGAELAREAGDIDLELRAKANLAASLSTHDVREARRTCQDALRLATRLGMRKNALWLTSLDLSMAGDDGLDWDGPTSVIEASLAEATEPYARLDLLAARLFFEVNRGLDTTATWSAVERLRALDPDLEELQLVASFRAVEQALGGDPRGAADHLRGAMPAMGQERDVGLWMLLHVSLLLADPEVVREVADGVRELWVVGRGADGLKALARAGVAALADQPEESLSEFATAVERLDAAGWHFVAAQARLHALRLLPARPQLDAWRTEARTVFERVGAEPWLRLLETAGTASQGPTSGVAGTVVAKR